MKAVLMKWKRPYFSLISLALLIAAPALATEVNIVGLTAGKAVVTINGGAARVMRAGETSPEGVKLISATSDAAVFVFDNQRRTLHLGQAIAATYREKGLPKVVLTANAQGHFLTTGRINGRSIRFLVDTGASLVTLSSLQANQAGIDYRRGTPGRMATANGVVPVYRVSLDTIRVNGITLHQVDAAIISGG
ncbi:MAG TPA: TIGR02281 family clan AA aspartic protease, partial [Betaproteobacteria bacterium]|nr:TIGR02281 family clan AA aspartic protease [Betaproteobacteria bacterium]